MQHLALLRQPQRLATSLALRWPALCRGFAEQSGSDTITVETSPYRGHRVRLYKSQQHLQLMHRFQNRRRAC